MKLPKDEQKKQELYRDSRVSGHYDDIWQSVGKCVFCDLKDKYVFFEENGVVMTVNIHAYIDGHLMIIPRRHVRSVKELTPAEWETFRKFMYIAKKLIREVHGIKGIQIIQKDGADAQSTVEHLHFQVLPFDAPDLSVWNYRKLKYTPLENAKLYKDQTEKINKLNKRFEKQYSVSQRSTASKKEVYAQAFKQALLSKKTSQAKKTAKVGVSIIANNKIISTYNANLASGPMELEKDGTWVSTPTVSHAEERAIAQAARDGASLNGATMIITLSPCMACARLIINSGIKELHYIDDWWDQNALDFLTQNGVRVIKLPYNKKK